MFCVRTDPVDCETPDQLGNGASSLSSSSSSRQRKISPHHRASKTCSFDNVTRHSHTHHLQTAAQTSLTNYLPLTTSSRLLPKLHARGRLLAILRPAIPASQHELGPKPNLLASCTTF